MPVESTFYRIPNGIKCRIFDTPLLSSVPSINNIAGNKKKPPLVRDDTVRSLSIHFGPEIYLTQPFRNTPTNLRQRKHSFTTTTNQNQPSKPIVLFSHGFAGNADMYIHLCTDLVERTKCMVIALEHEDGSACHAQTFDGKNIPFVLLPRLQIGSHAYVRSKLFPCLEKRMSEITHALAYLTTILDFSHGVVLMGHSFGGATWIEYYQSLVDKTNTPEFLQLLPIKAMILLDPFIYPLEQNVPRPTYPPLLCISSEELQNKRPNELSGFFNNKEAVIVLNKFTHVAFSDIHFWAPRWLRECLSVGSTKSFEHMIELCVSHIIEYTA